MGENYINTIKKRHLLKKNKHKEKIYTKKRYIQKRKMKINTERRYIQRRDIHREETYTIRKYI